MKSGCSSSRIRTGVTVFFMITVAVVSLFFLSEHVSSVADAGNLQIVQEIQSQCIEKGQSADITLTITNAPQSITSLAVKIVTDDEVIDITQGQITAPEPFLSAFSPDEILQGVAAWPEAVDLNNVAICSFTISSLKACEKTDIVCTVMTDFADGSRQQAEHVLSISTCSHTNRTLATGTATHHISKCTECTFSEEIEHTFDLQIVDNKHIKQEADCLIPDTYYLSCQCGTSSADANLVFTDGEALGHECSSYTYNNDATCTENGTETGPCIRCSTPMTREAADTKLGHNYTSVVTPPTRDDQGYTTHSCTRCDDEYVDTYVPAIGYDFGDMNKDGYVTVEDAVLLHNHINNSADYPLAEDRDTDVNNDGITDKADVEYLIKYLLYPETYPLVKEGALIPVLPEINTISSDRIFALTAGKQEVTHGQQFTVTVSVSGENMLDIIGFTIVYDSNVFEIIDAKPSEQLSDIVWGFDPENNLYLMTNTNEELTGDLFTFTLQVKNDVEEGTCDISVTPVVRNDNNTLQTTVTATQIKVIDIVRGDVNGNNAVTSDDAVYLLRHIFMPSFYQINQSGDMNADGAVTSADAVYLLRHIFMPGFYPLS